MGPHFGSMNADYKFMQATHHVLIFGRVQGVGYRESMRAEACRAGCTGWVRNRADGSVEATLEGAAEAVESVLAWARRGPPAARVDRVQVAEGRGGFATFEVLRTA
jgi:acylphosphatase